MPGLNIERTTNEYVILASQTSTATNTGTTAVQIPRPLYLTFYHVDVTVDETAANDTLDLFIQTQIGSRWIDIVRFELILGNAGAQLYVSDAQVRAAISQNEFHSGDAMAAASVRALYGTNIRARWVIVSGTGASFTFSVACSLQ